MDTVTTTVTTEVLCDNEWLALLIIRGPEAGIDGYVYSHETRCKGRVIAVLPYADRPEGRRYLVKSEVTPCWSLEPRLSAVTGGYEGRAPEDDAVREMLEETGYAIDREDLIPLGESFASKSSDTVYSLYGVDLTGREPGEALGDGSRLEAEATTAWLTSTELANLGDPQVSVMFLRLAHLGVAA
jgi:8-oxo-dGTP pyrophosphatase MutT (NUDIX family)